MVAAEDSDAFAGHIGGDDFALIAGATAMTRLGTSLIDHFCRRSRESTARMAYTLSGKTLPSISLSAVSVQAGMSFHEISERAFQLKKKAKALGRNAFILDAVEVPLNGVTVHSAGATRI